jgi:hypothetical protein
MSAPAVVAVGPTETAVPVADDEPVAATSLTVALVPDDPEKLTRMPAPRVDADVVN